MSLHNNAKSSSSSSSPHRRVGERIGASESCCCSSSSITTALLTSSTSDNDNDIDSCCTKTADRHGSSKSSSSSSSSTAASSSNLTTSHHRHHDHLQQHHARLNQHNETTQHHHHHQNWSSPRRRRHHHPLTLLRFLLLVLILAMVSPFWQTTVLLLKYKEDHSRLHHSLSVPNDSTTAASRKEAATENDKLIQKNHNKDVVEHDDNDNNKNFLDEHPNKNSIKNKKNDRHDRSDDDDDDITELFVPLLNRYVSVPVPVVLYPYAVIGSKPGQGFHLGEDGIRQSPYLRLVEADDIVNDNNNDSDNNSGMNAVLSYVNRNPDVVWVADESEGGAPQMPWCRNFVKEVKKVQSERRSIRQQQQQHVSNSSSSSAAAVLPVTWPIHFLQVYYDFDFWFKCKPAVDTIVENLAYAARHDVPPKTATTNNGMTVKKKKNRKDSKTMIGYYKRSMVKNRHWNATTNYVELGTLRPDIPLEAGRDVILQHTPIAVRTDIVQGVADCLLKHGYTLSSPYETVLDRPVDVAHYWPVKPPVNEHAIGFENLQVVGFQGRLRYLVSQELLRFAHDVRHAAAAASAATSNNSSSSSSRRHLAPGGAGGAAEAAAAAGLASLNLQVEVAGVARAKGRAEVSPEYIESMMRTKIIVVTQRDEWEDHYRLFEAAVSGALVMTDTMLSLPAGLVSGRSVVEFSTIDDLKSKIVYYLTHETERRAIAKRGKDVALQQHRSWHRMEEVIFGRRVSDGGCRRNFHRDDDNMSVLLPNNNNNNACPYTVNHHAKS